MESLVTDRLLLRPLQPSDAAMIHAYRNDPSTARHQSWVLPYPLAKAETMVAEIMALDGPTDGEWYALAIVETSTGEMCGDVVCQLTWGGKTAEIGYTLSASARGKGYATEAAATFVEYLFGNLGVHRVEATLHPDNWDSAMVLERLGLLYEGTRRGAYWVGDECSDDPMYAMVRSDWEAWRARPRQRPDVVELAEITWRDARQVLALRTHRSQTRFVSPMERSFADALFPDVDDGGQPLVPWPRAIRADGDLAGFVMVAEPTAVNPDPYLWRLLIDRMHQRRGIGTMVLDQIVERYRRAGHHRLVVSYFPARGGPEPLYRNYGFVPTGEIDDGEIVAEFAL